jgi:hypothetical protein
MKQDKQIKKNLRNFQCNTPPVLLPLINENGFYIVNKYNYKIKKKQIFFSTLYKIDNIIESKPQKPYYIKGSPYFGCPWFYRSSESINWTYKYFYKGNIIFQDKNKFICKNRLKIIILDNGSIYKDINKS